jgi:hypothetical protein
VATAWAGFPASRHLLLRPGPLPAPPRTLDPGYLRDPRLHAQSLPTGDKDT